MATSQTQHLKKRLFLLKAGRTCPLTSSDSTAEQMPSGFSAVIVYSFLVYRLKMAKGDTAKAAVTNKQIQRGTGLCRGRTIPPAIKLLESHGLAAKTNRRAFACQDNSNEWFVQIKNSQSKPWYARFGYFPAWIPSDGQQGLTPRQNALYWLVVSKPRQKQVYYSLCLGIDAKTVARAIAKLRTMGLLSRSGLEPLELTTSHMELWQDKAQRRSTQSEFRLSQLGFLARIHAESPFGWFTSGEQAGQSAYEQFCARIDAYGDHMVAAGYSRVEIIEFWDEFAKGIMLACNSMMPLEFHKIFTAAEALTVQNRATGSFRGANSLGLLRSLTRQAMQELQVVWQNHKKYGGIPIWSWTLPA